MAKIEWTLQAAEDLESITDFIATDSPHYANLFAIDILAAVERLAVFPESGRVVPELGVPEVREILFGNYRIAYRIERDSVTIITVYHGARLLNPSRLTNPE